MGWLLNCVPGSVLSPLLASKTSGEGMRLKPRERFSNLSKATELEGGMAGIQIHSCMNQATLLLCISAHSDVVCPDSVGTSQRLQALP